MLDRVHEQMNNVWKEMDKMWEVFDEDTKLFEETISHKQGSTEDVTIRKKVSRQSILPIVLLCIALGFIFGMLITLLLT